MFKARHCFLINCPKQNARSLLTPVSDPAFYALSHGSKHFLLHGSSNNHLFQRFWLAVEEFWPIRKWLKKLPWRAKLRLPCERAWKAGSETGVKSDLAFCLRSLFKKTNSVRECKNTKADIPDFIWLLFDLKWERQKGSKYNMRHSEKWSFIFFDRHTYTKRVTYYFQLFHTPRPKEENQ